MVQEQLLQLYKLQKFDAEIVEFERKKAIIEKKANEIEAATDVLRQALGKLVSEANAKKIVIHDHNENLENNKRNLRKWEERLQAIKTTREYQALSREIENLRWENKNIQESILNVQIEVDDLEKRMKEQKDILVSKEDISNAEIRDLRGQIAELMEVLPRLLQSREEACSLIETGLLKKYDKIKKARDSIALAVVSDGICMACHVTLRPQLYNELQLSLKVENCPHCQRILLWDGLLNAFKEKQLTT